jgi:hypothetical protein
MPDGETLPEKRSRSLFDPVTSRLTLEVSFWILVTVISLAGIAFLLATFFDDGMGESGC